MAKLIDAGELVAIWRDVQRQHEMRVKAQRKAEMIRRQYLVSLQCQRGLPHPTGWMPAYRDYYDYDFLWHGLRAGQTG